MMLRIELFKRNSKFYKLEERKDSLIASSMMVSQF